MTIFWQQKEDPYHVRYTIGGNIINYQGETDTQTADITTANTLLNSIISANGARFICIDWSKSYRITPFNNISDYEYAWIPDWVIPKDITEEYNLQPLIKNVCVLSECRTCICGLPQAGRFNYTKLLKHLSDYCYFVTGHAPGISLHLTRPTTFNIVVDDFGTKIVGNHNANHLTNTQKTLRCHCWLERWKFTWN